MAGLLKEMALTRAKFKEHAYSHAIGCMKEFYKARLAEKNGSTTYVRHWYGEADRLAELFAASVYELTKGFKDYRKALKEALALALTKDLQMRGHVARRLQNRYDVEIETPLDDGDRLAYTNLITSAMDDALDFVEED